MEIYQRLADTKELVTDDVLSRLGRSALKLDDRKTAAQAYLRVYYEFPLTDAATAAASQLADAAGSDRQVRLSVGSRTRGDAVRRAALRRGARARFRTCSGWPAATIASWSISASRSATTTCGATRRRATAVRPYLERASRKAEARFFHLSALRELGPHDEYVAQTRALVADFPGRLLVRRGAQQPRHPLHRHQPGRGRGAGLRASCSRSFPTGPRAERAAWKAGWWSYRNGDYAATVRTFEGAAATFPRSDYRPSYLYWAARAHGAARPWRGGRRRASGWSFTDYGNSYYGRLAAQACGARRERPTQPPIGRWPRHFRAPRPPAPPPTADRIRLLLANGLYDEALDELRFAQRQWGTSPAIEATIAWAYHQKGELRRAITLMRRAYPQSLDVGRTTAAAGDRAGASSRWCTGS